MADPESDYAKRLADIVEKFGSQTNALGDAMKKAEFATRAMNLKGMSAAEGARQQKIAETELIKTGQKEYRKLTDLFVKGQITQQELDRAYSKQIKKIESNNKLSDDQKDAMKAAIDVAKTRGEAESAAADATQKYSKAMDKASAVFKPAYEAVSGVLSGMRNKDLLGGAGQVLQAELKGAGSAASGIGSALTDTAPALASLGKGGKYAAGAAVALGIGLQAAGAGAKALSEIIGPMTAIIQEFSANYTKASQAGMVLAGGMGELRDTAGKAGMRMSDLVDGITSGQEAFQRSGLSVTQATKMVGNFGKGLVEGKDATALFALGYTDAASRVKLAASAYDQARASGMSQADAQKNITALTVDYAKDLKSLQAIVGANAEKELEKGRAEAQRGALMSKLDKDQATAFEQVYASLDKFGPQADKVRLGLSQLANNGVITDPDILLNKPLMDMLESMNQTIQSGSKDALAKAGEAIAKAGEDTRQDIKSGGSLAVYDEATLAMGKNGDATVASTAALINQVAQTRLSTDAAEEARKNAEKAAQAKDPATAQMDAITQNQQKLSVALEQAATSAGALKVFGDAVTTAQGAVQTLIDKINGVASGKPVTDTSTSIKDTAMMAVGAAMPFAMDIANKIKGPIDAAKTGATVATDAAKTGATVVGDVAKTAAVAETKVVANAGEKTAAAALKAGGSAMGKTALKAIPFVGLGLSLWDAASRVKDGDYLGAAIAAGGGVASMFPGIGTGLAIAADAANLARDVTGVTKSGGEGISDAEKTKAMTDAKAEMDRESSRGRGLSTTASIEEAKALAAAEMDRESSRGRGMSQQADDGIPTITVGRPQSMGSTALSESLGDMADVLSEDTAQQQEVAQVEQAKATEEAAKKEQERQVFESMAVFLQQMNERMADMVDISRLTADHTERTARGVQ